MEQSRVNLFADATDDHQYIHVDPEKAKSHRLGGPCAWLPDAVAGRARAGRLVRVTDARTGVNYGLDRVRFPAPLLVGARWRGGAELWRCPRSTAACS